MKMKRLPSLILGVGVGMTFGTNSILIDAFGKNLVNIFGLVIFIAGMFLIILNKDGLGTK